MSLELHFCYQKKDSAGPGYFQRASAAAEAENILVVDASSGLWFG